MSSNLLNNKLGIWIWQIKNCSSGNWQTICKNCNDAGIDYLLFKSGDSGPYFNPQTIKDIVKVCQDHNITIGTWNYSVPSTIDEQVSQITSLFNSGIQFHSIDAELEWQQEQNTDKNVSAVAEQFMQKLRSSVGNNFLAHAPFPVISYHYSFPYTSFGKYVDLVMPQSYWTEIGWDVNKTIQITDSEWSKYYSQHPEAVKPVAPIGVTYGKGLGAVPGEFHLQDMVTFIQHYQSKNVPVSLYTIDAAFPGVFDTLKKIKNNEPVVFTPSTTVISVPTAPVVLVPIQPTYIPTTVVTQPQPPIPPVSIQPVNKINLQTIFSTLSDLVIKFIKIIFHIT